MSESASSRASAADRERALQELSQHLGSGRLSLVEFDERSAAVVAATSRHQLAEQFADLPGAAPSAPQSAAVNPLPGLVVLIGAATVFAFVLAVTTGNWLWLFVVLSAPALFALTRRVS